MTNVAQEFSPTRTKNGLNGAFLRRADSWERIRLNLLAAPALLLIGAVLLVPLAWLAWLSAFDASGAITLANYERLLRPSYVQSFLTTFEVAGLVTMCCILLGYPVAYLLSQLPARTAQVLALLVILPFWVSVLVRTYAWLVLLQRQGLINSWLVKVGFISEPIPLVHNMLGTVIGMIHIMLPFLVLPLYASMKAVDPRLLLAAANCGATPAQAFRHIFLPLSMPGLASGAGLTFVLCLGFFVTPALLGGGRVNMWAMQIADNIAKYGNWGAASSLGVALLVVTAALLWALRKSLKLLKFEGPH